VCALGGCYRHLSVDLPRHARGCELSAAELEAYGARLETYVIRRGDPA